MCLAVPVPIVSRDVNLTLLGDQDVVIGHYVLAHVGYALQTIAAEDAQAGWAFFDDVSAVLYPTDA
jgi:hydrogenase expression/formation protein HypC